MSYMGKNTSLKAKKIRQILNRKIFVPFYFEPVCLLFQLATKASSAEPVLASAHQNLCCSYWEFWQALTRTHSVEHASD